MPFSAMWDFGATHELHMSGSHSWTTTSVVQRFQSPPCICHVFPRSTFCKLLPANVVLQGQEPRQVMGFSCHRRPASVPSSFWEQRLYFCKEQIFDHPTQYGCFSRPSGASIRRVTRMNESVCLRRTQARKKTCRQLPELSQCQRRTYAVCFDWTKCRQLRSFWARSQTNLRISSHTQKFQVHKMEVLTYVSCMDNAYVSVIQIPKISCEDQRLGIQNTSWGPSGNWKTKDTTPFLLGWSKLDFIEYTFKAAKIEDIPYNEGSWILTGIL